MKFTIETEQNLKMREDVIFSHLCKIKRTCVINNRLIVAVACFIEETEPSLAKVKKVFSKLAENPSYYGLSLRDVIINPKK